MRITEGELAGLLLIAPAVFGDDRGFFLELWNEQSYRTSGLEAAFVQDNFSCSRRGSLRGLHFQNPSPQGKLVSVLQGEVYDVAVDLRRRSPTFGRWAATILSAASKQQLYVPAGFAHGFQALSDGALFHYKCTAPYSRRDERTVRWDDPQLGIAWPIRDGLVSAKDAQAPLLRDLAPEDLFD